MAVLHHDDALEPLLEAVDGVDRLVLLGDVVELRQGPAEEALAAARPVLAALAQRAGEVVVVPGNHDHGLARRGLELGIEARLEYPGLWLRDDVFATHGHYLDLHGTVPSFERIGAGLMAKMVGAPPETRATDDDYEAILAPIYAWIEEAAEHARNGRRAGGSARSGEVWSAMAGTGRRTVRARALLASFPVGIATLNKIGVGPLSRDLSGPALRRGLLAGLKEALRRLGVVAPHVIFGHTHRTGPLPGDDPAEWRAGSTQLHNCGSWVYEPRFVGDGGPDAPHWPGGAILLEGEEPPRLLRLLAGVPKERLRA